MGKKRDVGFDPPFNLYLLAGQRSRLQDLAQQAGTSETEQVRIAVERHLLNPPPLPSAAPLPPAPPPAPAG